MRFIATAISLCLFSWWSHVCSASDLRIVIFHCFLTKNHCNFNVPTLSLKCVTFNLLPPYVLLKCTLISVKVTHFWHPIFDTFWAVFEALNCVLTVSQLIHMSPYIYFMWHLLFFMVLKFTNSLFVKMVHFGTCVTT